MSVDEEVEEGRRRHSFAGLIVAIVLMLLLLGAVIGFAKWKSRGLDYAIHFEDAKGLQVGDPVMLSGVQIGEIREVELQAEEDVRVAVHIQDEHAEKILAGSTAIIANNTFPNVSGQKVVEIHNPADETAGPLLEGAEVEGRNGLLDLKAWQIEEELGEVGKELGESSKALSKKMSDVIEEMKDIPESPEVKEALERIEKISKDLKLRGEEKFEDLSKEWNEFSTEYAPLIDLWKEKSKEKAREAYDKTRTAVEQGVKRARERYEEARSETRPVE